MLGSCCPFALSTQSRPATRGSVPYQCSGTHPPKLSGTLCPPNKRQEGGGWRQTPTSPKHPTNKPQQNQQHGRDPHPHACKAERNNSAISSEIQTALLLDSLRSGCWCTAMETASAQMSNGSSTLQDLKGGQTGGRA